MQRKSHGLSVFLIDLHDALAHGLTVEPIPIMLNNETNKLIFDNVPIPASSLIGEEGRGFRYILDGMNAERILIAAECIGDGRWFVERATGRAKEREVFGRPIGQNQGVQFPIARAHVNVEAADLMRFRAAELFDRGEPCGAEANMAKLLAADASWEAANVALQTYGGYGFAAEYDIERKFRETRLYQVAPHLHKPHPLLRRRARARPAEVVLMLPLEGITVVALEQAVAVPFATRQLADLGARVIKIERVGVGDFARQYESAVRGMSAHFVWLNRSKESLALDMKHPEAQRIVHQLLETADVFIQNLAPGAADTARLRRGGAPRDSIRA